MDIITERVMLSEITKEDAPFMFQLLNSPKWIQFIGDRNIQSLENAADYIENIIRKSYATHGFGFYNIQEIHSKKTVGITGLVKRDFLEDIDIGYALLPEFEGKGYAFEATLALYRYAKLKLNIKTLLAFTTPDNLRSIHLLEKLGMQFIQTFLYPDSDELLNLYSDTPEKKHIITTG